MSTDDLIRRARDVAVLFGDGDLGYIVSELADLVDRLRTANALNIEGLQVELADAIYTVDEIRAERDAARAALERVKDELIKHGKHIPDPQDEHLASADYWRGARDAVEHIQASVHFALEGES